MNRNEMITLVAAFVCIAAALIFTRTPSSSATCGSRHLSVEWMGNQRIGAVIINGHRIEATNGVVSLTYFSFDHEKQIGVDSTNRMTLPDADVGARPGDSSVTKTTGPSLPSETPDWFMYITNENTNGPTGVFQYSKTRIVGDYRIDYSTNFAAKWLK